jgi:hypothetical protein
MIFEFLVPISGRTNLCYITCPSHLPLFYYLIRVVRRVQITKVLTTKLSHFWDSPTLLRFKYSHEPPVLEPLQSMCFHCMNNQMKQTDTVLETNCVIIIELVLFLKQKASIWLQCYIQILRNEATSLPCLVWITDNKISMTLVQWRFYLYKSKCLLTLFRSEPYLYPQQLSLRGQK